MTYSVDFRNKVLKIREQENLSIREVAKRFAIGFSSVTRWIKEPNPKQKRNNKNRYGST